MPHSSVTLYCTFRSAHVARIPDDGIYIYSIFQKEISPEKLTGALTGKAKERVARKVTLEFPATNLRPQKQFCDFPFCK
ncbi:unnamed protein product [Gongylonema pulchrum]|uniref:MSP domain-containing protein n=1 Tax=Gongylonema pulchrum TaxID=637853 RepID=A0A183DLX1_9BILA|nr:unnamed protein product [Gongylonema pulchrum]